MGGVIGWNTLVPENDGDKGHHVAASALARSRPNRLELPEIASFAKCRAVDGDMGGNGQGNVREVPKTFIRALRYPFQDIRRGLQPLKEPNTAQLSHAGRM